MDEQKIIKEKRKSVFQLVAIVVLAVILFSAVYFIKHSMPDGGLLAASLGGVALSGNPLHSVHTAIFGSLDSFPLLAVPLFILAAAGSRKSGLS